MPGSVRRAPQKEEPKKKKKKYSRDNYTKPCDLRVITLDSCSTLNPK